MASINTNIAAMTALQSLNQTNKEMLTTQNRVSTGYRVKDASDNAAYWSIATTMRSDRGAISTVVDALGLGAATVDTANTGVTKAIETASTIKQKLVAARQPGVDRAKIQSEITELQNSLRSAVETSSFSGQNWLSVDSTGTTERSLVSSFSRDSTGAISIGTITVDIGATGTDAYRFLGRRRRHPRLGPHGHERRHLQHSEPGHQRSDRRNRRSHGSRGLHLGC